MKNKILHPIDLGLSVRWASANLNGLYSVEGREVFEDIYWGWRLPTRKEYDELMMKCPHKVIRDLKDPGFLFTDGSRELFFSFCPFEETDGKQYIQHSCFCLASDGLVVFNDKSDMRNINLSKCSVRLVQDKPRIE